MQTAHKSSATLFIFTKQIHSHIIINKVIDLGIQHLVNKIVLLYDTSKHIQGINQSRGKSPLLLRKLTRIHVLLPREENMGGIRRYS